MKKHFPIVFLALTIVFFSACKNTESGNQTTCNADSIIADYLIKARLADSAFVFDKDNLRGHKTPGMFDLFYLPTPFEYDNPLMHKFEVAAMITRYQSTRKAEVGSFLINAEHLINYLTALQAEGATDIQFILGQQPEVAGKIDDVTIIVVGAKDISGAWSHIYGTHEGAKDAVLQHVKPLRLTDKPSTTLE